MNFLFGSVLGKAVYGGASFGECYYAADRVKDGDIDSWIEAFAELADKVEAQAQSALALGHAASARDSFLRASTYAFAADHYTYEGHPSYHVQRQKSVDCFRKAAPLFEQPLEPVAFPMPAKRCRATSCVQTTVVSVDQRCSL